jgi:hypothetical protein
MSQIYKSLAAGPVPPTVPTSFVTDDGTAVPALNTLNVNGIDSTENNANGILTRANPNLSNNLEIVVTNRLQGTGTTVSTGTADIVTFVPNVIGVYSLEFRVAAYNTTSLLGAGYSLFGAIRFDGVNSNICDPFDPIDNEEGTMVNTGLNIFVSGSNVILRATGYLAQTINWSAVGLYTFAGA